MSKNIKNNIGSGVFSSDLRLVALSADLYGVLGISKNASQKEIKKAYHKKAIEYHPDKNESNFEKEEMFKVCSVANEVLLNTEKRNIYNYYRELFLEEERKRKAELEKERKRKAEIVLALYKDVYAYRKKRGIWEHCSNAPQDNIIDILRKNRENKR